MVLSTYKVQVKTKSRKTDVFTKAINGIEARNNVTRFLNKIKDKVSFPVSATKVNRQLTILEKQRLI